MKNSLKAIALWAFVIMIAISMFVYFGNTSGSFTPGVQVLGTVNGYPIVNKQISEFSDQIRLMREDYEKQGLDIEKYGGVIVNEAFYRSVVNFLVGEEAKRNGITVSEADVVRSIKEDYFKNDREEFISFSKTGEVALQRDLEELTRARLQKNYYEDVLRGIPYSPNQLEEKIRIASRERRALVAVLDLGEAAEKQISRDVLLKYYQDNISRYTSETNSSFESSYDNVLSDYLLENKENLIGLVQNSVSFQFKNLTSNRVDAATFRSVAAENGMRVNESSRFNFFTDVIFDLTGTGTPLISDPSAIRKLFLTPVNSVSDVIVQENELTVVYITEETIDEEVSSFVKRSYVRDLDKEVSKQIFNAYYTYLYKGSKVEVNQQQGPAQ